MTSSLGSSGLLASAALPAYDDLPIAEGKPPGSSWGLWGETDVLGCLNLLTPARVMAALGEVREGDVFSLNLDLDLPDPPLFDRSAMHHDVLWIDDGLGHDDELSSLNTQASSQWDGFRHVRHPQYGWYNGIDDDQHGVEHWSRKGLVGRAVVCDVWRWRQGVGRPIEQATNDVITADEILATLAEQGSVVETGDFLLVHTGWLDWYRALDDAGRRQVAGPGPTQAPGLAPGTTTVRMLWDLHLAAVAADNPGLEIEPAGSNLTAEEAAASHLPDHHHERSAHFSLLPLLGMPIGELWDLGKLAAACAADRRWSCMLTSAPLNLRHGVASPPNALAIR
jgi:kynurenine formamidase